MRAEDSKAKSKEPAPYVRIKIEVEIQGILRHSAKGTFLETAEETYYVYDDDPKMDTSKKETSMWQLDLRKAKDLRKRLAELNGQSVVVNGTSELRKTIRIKLASANKRERFLPKKVYTSEQKWSPSRTLVVTSWKEVESK
jgi:hypothetical protein